MKNIKVLRSSHIHRMKEIGMKNVGALLLLSLLFGATRLYAADSGLEQFVSRFDYAARKDMKIDSKTLIPLLKSGKAQLVDIRFKEENTTWKVNPSISIPLNELPGRLSEIDVNRVVVVACPHKDRATIAMVYLRSHGIKAKYLTDGLLGLTENLRGDAAKELVDALTGRE